MPYVDCFLYDYKATDDVLHKKLTGVSNRLILKNLELINSSGKRLYCDVPLFRALTTRMSTWPVLPEFSSGTI